MHKDKVETLLQQISNYAISKCRINPFICLYGEENDGKESIKSNHYAIDSINSFEEIIKMLTGYKDRINKYIYSGKSVDELKSGSESKLLFHKMNEQDFEMTLSFIRKNNEKCNFDDFLKPNKFKNSFLIIEIDLDSSNQKKLLFLKSIPQNYYSAKHHNFSITSVYNNNPKITFINRKRDLLLSDEFEMVAFLDNKNPDTSFFIIQNIDRFEELYRYLRRYTEAYDKLSKMLDFVEWKNVEPSPSAKKKCFELMNNEFFEECIHQLKINLASKEDNQIKKAFFSKQIKYYVDNEGNIKIVPQSKNELKALLRIINDEVASTALLHRSVIGSNYEII
ncbi:MAG: hypothetical protein ACC612_01085 [Methanomethylovorans sp.]|uniref:hypothetical protein n=1 Tax=Methanomethylovorans sp. TaxID=2758717 RepID=UPI0035317168